MCVCVGGEGVCVGGGWRGGGGEKGILCSEAGRENNQHKDA